MKILFVVGLKENWPVDTLLSLTQKVITKSVSTGDSTLNRIGVTLHDPAFKAALIDENRRKFNLNILLVGVMRENKS